eukprot:COSAG05_NODE_5402_length_1186_cov_1.462741_1_plen_360_part_10
MGTEEATEEVLADETMDAGAEAGLAAEAEIESTEVDESTFLAYLPVLVALGVGVASWLAYKWKCARDEAALAKQLSGGLFGEDSDAEITTDEKGVLKTAAGANEDEMGDMGMAGGTIDLGGYPPVVDMAWEEFNTVTQGKDYVKNIEPLEKILETFEKFLPGSHHCTTQTFIHLARCYQHAQQWNKCDKLCTRATDKLDTETAGGAVKQALITILCCQGLACFRTGLDKRKTHAENCYRRALNVVREMSHPSWRPVELKTSHEFANELISAGLHETAIVEVNKTLELLQRLEHPPRPPKEGSESEHSSDEEEEPPPPQIDATSAALTRANLLRTLAHAQQIGQDKPGAEKSLLQAIKLAD